MYNLNDLINSFPHDVKIIALRTVTNSALARTIGALRRAIWERKKEQISPDVLTKTLIQLQHDDNSELFVFDQHNADDADDGGETQAAVTGHPPPESALLQASRLHAVWTYCNDELETLAAGDKWKSAMSFDDMTNFMATKENGLTGEFAQAMAEATGVPIETLQAMSRQAQAMERASFREDLPELKQMWESLGNYGYDNCIEALDTVTHHQLSIKVAEGLGKAYGQITMRMIRRQTLEDIGVLPQLVATYPSVEQWVEDFEHKNRAELSDAIESGRTVHTLPNWPFPTPRKQADAA